MVQMYEEIGLKVHLEPIPEKDKNEQGDYRTCSDGGCTVCFDADRDRYRIIFTKRV
jgi:hypothetical protein